MTLREMILLLFSDELQVNILSVDWFPVAHCLSFQFLTKLYLTANNLEVSSQNVKNGANVIDYW